MYSLLEHLLLIPVFVYNRIGHCFTRYGEQEQFMIYSTDSQVTRFFYPIFLAHGMSAHAVNAYRRGEMSAEVVVDRNLCTEVVDRRRK